MCNFPDIPYDPNFADLSNQNIPQGTYTYLKNNDIVDNNLLDGITSMKELEEFINAQIKAYNGNNDDKLLYNIFCLIHIWGGNFGKRFFIENPDFQIQWDTKIKEKYRELVNVCREITINKNNALGISNDDIDKVYNAICALMNSRDVQKKKLVPGLGVAFLTKHTRFWLQQNNYNNPLPIFDSVMSWGLFKRENADISSLKRYWRCMIDKAISLNNKMTLLVLERQLFNYFPSIDERKKKNNQKNTLSTSTQTKTNSKIDRPIDNQTPSLYQIEGRHDVLEEERIRINGISILLIFGRTPRGCHFCGFWNRDTQNVSIDSIAEIQDIINKLSLSSLPWKTESTNSRRYVMYRSKDSYIKAKELKDKITKFIHNNKH